jgi:hypothetical protein
MADGGAEVTTATFLLVLARVGWALVGALIVIVLAIFLFGCGPPCELSRATEQDATRIVWREVYGRREDPPLVLWRTEQYEVTTRSRHREGPFQLRVDGSFWGAKYAAVVVWKGTFAGSAFAHELLHAHLHLKGIEDFDHEAAEWGTLLPRAEAALRRRGL